MKIRLPELVRPLLQSDKSSVTAVNSRSLENCSPRQDATCMQRIGQVLDGIPSLGRKSESE